MARWSEGHLQEESGQASLGVTAARDFLANRAPSRTLACKPRAFRTFIAAIHEDESRAPFSMKLYHCRLLGLVAQPCFPEGK
jgi:hypothetical protein